MKTNKLGLLLATIVFAGYSQSAIGQNLDDGLVAYYPFNGNANDESGNGNNGEVNGAALAVDRYGESGKAYSFDGENDWIELPNPNIIGSAKDFTILAWVNEQGDDNGSIYGEFHTSAGHVRNNLYLSNKIAFDQFWPTGGGLLGGSSVVKSKWQYVGITKSGSDWTMYLNGESDNSGSNAETYSGFTPNKSYLGARSYTYDGNSMGAQALFKGLLDDVRIYNRALTEEEVVALYELEDTPSVSQPKGQNLELNESFEISVGDILVFEFEDQGCSAGYQGVWLDDGQLNYMVYMQDCGWGPWAPGKKGNDIYYAMGQALEHTQYKDPVYRSIGWHEAKYRVTESEIIQEVDGKIVERFQRGSKDYWSLTERTKTAKVVNDHPNSLIRPSNVRNIKLVKGDDQPEPTGTITNFTFETPKINSKGNLIIKAKGPDNSSVTYQFTYDLINWQDQFTLPMPKGESTITLPVPKTSQDSQFFYRLKLAE